MEKNTAEKEAEDFEAARQTALRTRSYFFAERYGD